jgi:TPR repeat protein
MWYGAANQTGFDGPEDLKVAAHAYERACEGGVGAACRQLGMLYLYGASVPHDESRASRLMRDGCEKGDQEACKLAHGMAHLAR